MAPAAHAYREIKNSVVTVRSSDRWGGIIYSINWNGTEMINAADPGQEVQSALFGKDWQTNLILGKLNDVSANIPLPPYDGSWRANPTEGGSNKYYGPPDFVGSPKIDYRQTSTQIFAESYPVEWNANRFRADPLIYKTPMSHQIDLNAGGYSNAMTFQAHLQIPLTGSWQAELPTVYMRREFNERYFLDVVNNTLTRSPARTWGFISSMVGIIYCKEAGDPNLDGDDIGLGLFARSGGPGTTWGIFPEIGGTFKMNLYKPYGPMNTNDNLDQTSYLVVGTRDEIMATARALYLSGVGSSATVVTNAATAISANAATLNATVNAGGGATTANFDYGLTATYGQSAAVTPAPTSGTANQAVSANISGLTQNTLYHFRASATNGVGTLNGADVTFATGNTAPTLEKGVFSAALNKAFSYPIVGTDAGDTLTYALTDVGTLPFPLTVSSAGMVSSTPDATGAFVFGVTVTDSQGATATNLFKLTVVNLPSGDGVAPILTRSTFASTLTRDQLANTTFIGTVQDLASQGVMPSGVRRVQVQLRRTSDGFAYNGSVFAAKQTPYYVVAPDTPVPNNTSGISNYSLGLSFVPSASILSDGDYSLYLLGLDNAGNFGGVLIPFTIANPPAAKSVPPVIRAGTSSFGSGGGS